MIRFATKDECEQIVSLWQEAFGDSRQWVLLYLEENIENVLVFEEAGVVFGMISLLPVSYKGKKGYYIYGVATGRRFRSMGVSTKLLAYAKGLVDEKKVDFLVLVPRNEGLFEFYGDRGFSPLICVETKELSKEELVDGVSVWEASPEEYYDIRKESFENLIEWDAEMLSSIKKFENGKYYKAENGGAFCYSYEGRLYVKELCGEIGIVAGIIKDYDCDRIFVTSKSDSKKPSCMTYPEFFDDAFFNISID